MTAFQRSKKRSSFTGQLFIYGLAALLMVFTGYRTFDLISRTLPEEAHILAAIAILCFDGGIAIWLFYFSRMAKSNEQIGISGILTVLDFLGMGTLFVIHTIISQNFFSTDWNPGGLVVVTTSFGVLSNVAGIIAVHFFDPDEKLARARRDAEAEHLAVPLVEGADDVAVAAFGQRLGIEAGGVVGGDGALFAGHVLARVRDRGGPGGAALSPVVHEPMAHHWRPPGIFRPV